MTVTTSIAFTWDGLLHCSSAPRWHYCNINRQECQFSHQTFDDLVYFQTWHGFYAQNYWDWIYGSPKKPWVSKTQENASRIFLCVVRFIHPQIPPTTTKNLGVHVDDACVKPIRWEIPACVRRNKPSYTCSMAYIDRALRKNLSLLRKFPEGSELLRCHNYTKCHEVGGGTFYLLVGDINCWLCSRDPW